MKINEVEARVGITRKNIRFYEEQGLLSPPRDSRNGYRDYGPAEVDALRRIKLMRKLGVPLEEIRRMQAGQGTVADGMRRHLITLERQRKDLDQAAALCARLKTEEVRLDALDAQAILEEMERLEQAGTAFQDSQRRDVKPARYAASAVAAAAMTGLMLAVIALLGWAWLASPEDAPPPWMLAVLAMIPLVVIGGVLLALYQRIKEIGKGEIDDAKQY